MPINTLQSLPSAAQTASGSAAPVQVGATSTVAVDINVSAVSGTSPTLQFNLDRLGADGIWYSAWQSSSINATGQTSTSVGPGCATAAVLTDKIRLRWTIGGTTPSFTFSASLIGRAVSGT